MDSLNLIFLIAMDSVTDSDICLRGKEGKEGRLPDEVKKTNFKKFKACMPNHI